MRYELLGCALHGHTVVGTDAATVADDADTALLVRVDTTDPADPARRWYRCLRCDAWEPRAAPAAPTRERVPGPDEVEVPLRGRPLRDRFVLRLIALDRLVHVVVLVLVGVALLVLLAHRDEWRPVVATLHGLAPGSTLIADLGRVLAASTRSLGWLAVAVLAYAALEAVEAVGLWCARRWAEYLTFVATTVLFVPEVYELVHGTTLPKILALLVNIAVVVYLLVAKRLFGLRGGGRTEAALRARDTGWAAVRRAGPPPLTPVPRS